MFVVTADQINSRDQPDAVRAMIERLSAELGSGLPLPPDRSAGDEVQLLASDPGIVLRAILLLTRDRDWSVGVGVGEVREPLGASIRESTGPAFIAARAAVERAKRKPTKFALAAPEHPTRAVDAEAFLDLLLLLRRRRTEEGWEIHDLLQRGLTQAMAAKQLSITPQAASNRAQTADLKAEAATMEGFVRLLRKLEEESE